MAAKISLTLATHWGVGQKEIIDAYVEEYMAAHPEVEITHLATASFDIVEYLQSVGQWRLCRLRSCPLEAVGTASVRASGRWQALITITDPACSQMSRSPQVISTRLSANTEEATVYRRI
ncbi:MAG: hypothetical protein ACOX4G_01135 [Limnochordia bacterium]